jgi:hypothetical protein
MSLILLAAQCCEARRQLHCHLVLRSLASPLPCLCCPASLSKLAHRSRDLLHKRARLVVKRVSSAGLE